MMGKRFTAVAVTVALATVAAACGSDDDSGSDPSVVESGGDTTNPPTDSEPETTDGDSTASTEPDAVPQAAIDPAKEIRTIATGPPPSSWDPATSTSSAQDTQWYLYVYDFVLRLNADNELEPHLATAWEYDDTSTVLTLTLRDDVTFTDGEAFDAEVAKQNLDRVKDGTGAAATLLAGIESIEAPDATTLVITQTEPSAKVIFGLASPAAAMVSPAAIADEGSLAQNPVGSGPYTMESVDATTGTFVYNEDYWDTEVVYPQRRTAIGTADGNARINALMSGTVDFANVSQTPPTPDMVAAAEAGDIQLAIVPGALAALGVNNNVAPFDDPLVLQAVNYALDRDTINEVTYNGDCAPTSQPFVEGQPGYIEGLEYEYDPDRALELIEQSGVAPGDLSIRLQSVAGVPTAPIELIQSMLEAVGFTVEIVNSPVQEVLPRFFAGEFQMSVVRVFLGMPDSSFVTDYLAGSQNPGTPDPELVALVDEANALDPADPDRAAAYEAINEYVHDNPMIIVECVAPNTMAASTEVVDFDQIPYATTGGQDISRLGLS